ncbi:hypothetical protein ACFE04_009494 [Oxalis oulophora]
MKPFEEHPTIPNITKEIPINALLPRQFPTHLDVPNISPSATIICEILTRASPQDIESKLSSSGVTPTSSLVEEILKLSYNNPSSAIKFFRWATNTCHLLDKAWNLMVDLLGKNQLFDPMWDAIRSMKQEGNLSLDTFVSVFGSYCMASRFSEAIMTFNVMDKYSIDSDVVALNSLLTAICREPHQTIKAFEFYEEVKTKIQPDGDTFAILLEGWEKEGNTARAKTTFGEMIIRCGWDPANAIAYETLLITLIRGSLEEEAIKFLKVMIGEKCLLGLKFFSNVLDIFIKRNDVIHAVSIWDMMVGSGLLPNLVMYDAMIGALCNNNDIDNAIRLLDEMVYHGAFPDSFTYNMIFQCLIKNKKIQDIGKCFIEMIKNECPPTHSNCAAAISVLLDGDDPEAALQIWDYMVEDRNIPLEGAANALLLGLCDLGRLSEVKRLAMDMIDQRINIFELTMAKLKTAFYHGSKNRDKFDSLERRGAIPTAAGRGPLTIKSEKREFVGTRVQVLPTLRTKKNENIMRMTIMKILIITIFVLGFAIDGYNCKLVQFIFGDSLSDVGNNRYLSRSLAQANLPFYGIDFGNGLPNGRFTNGRTVADIIGDKTGLPRPPAFLDPSLTEDVILNNGVNYASGGGGILNETGSLFIQRFSLYKQIELFQGTQEMIKKKIGKEAAEKFFQEARYVVALGSNDFINNYLMPVYTDSYKYNDQTFMDYLMETLGDQLTILHGLGVRQLMVFGLGPMGCIPLQRVLSTTGDCRDSTNTLALNFNKAGSKLIDGLSKKLPNASYQFGDSYDVVNDVIYKDRFSNTDSPCCSFWKIRPALTCTPASSLCKDRSKYLFWDEYHPSDKANELIANSLIKKFGFHNVNDPSPSPSPTEAPSSEDPSPSPADPPSTNN